MWFLLQRKAPKCFFSHELLIYFNIVLKFHMWHMLFCLYESYGGGGNKFGNIGNKNPPNPFWEQLLRAPFAAREWGNVSCISGRVEGKATEEEQRKCISSMRRLSSDVSASGASSGVLRCRPLSQQGTKINEGPFRQLNEAAVEPDNKWALK